MFKKLLATSATVSVSFALVGVLGGGVAAAHGGHDGVGHGVVHGAHIGGGFTPHGGQTAGSDGGGNAGGNTDTNAGSGAFLNSPNTGGVASPHGKAKGAKHGGPLVLTGSTTCSFHGKLTFNPRLTTGGVSNTTVTVTGLVNRCTNPNQGKVKFNNGHLSGLVGTLSLGDCSALTSVTPALSGGSVVWTPPSKIAASTGISMPAGTGSVVSHGGKSVIQLSYSGGMVGSGSFTNAGGVSLQVTSMQDTTQLSSRCVSGLTNEAFSGTATL